MDSNEFAKVFALAAIRPESFEPRDLAAKCDLCPFGGSERRPVPPKPPSSGKVKLVVVGEGPGRLELVKGQPFVGPSGALLDDSFAKAKLPLWRRETWLSNASLCSRPDATDLERDEAAACCAPRLMKELAALPPDAPIVALGKPAARALLGINGIMKVRGFVWRVREIGAAQIRGAYRAAEKAEASLKALKGRGPKERAERAEAQKEADLLKLKAELLEGRAALHGRVVLPSVHPAFVLRAATWRPVLDVDLDRVVRFLEKKVKPLDLGVKFEVLRDEKALRAKLPLLKQTIAHDIETDSKDPLEAKIRCLGMSDGEKTFVIYPWRRSYAKLVSACFKDRVVVGHNSFAYDEIALKREGIVYGARTEDTLIAHHAFASHFPQGLAFVASLFTDASPWKITFKQGAEGAEKGLPPSKLPVDDLVRYNAADCIITINAWYNMQADLEDERKVYEHDRELGQMCQEMQIAGIAVDLERREWLSGALKRRSARILRRMRELVGKKSFNPYATKDLREALFYKFRAPVFQMTAKTSLPSTSASVLQSLSQSRTRAGKLARLVLKYRGSRGTRQRNIEGVFVARDGRVHASWKSFGTMNGRLSCKMQQLPRAANPKKPILEDRIRELYVPKKGHVFVYFDLSQAEMRLAAYLSGDENFIKICSEKDVHSGNAVLIFPDAKKLILEDPKGAGKDFRDIAKETGFAVNYYAGEDTLFIRLQGKKLKTPVTMKTVRQMLAVVHRQFAGHFKYIDRNFQEVQRTGHMRTPLLGRIRWLGWNPPITEVANTPVQSGVADIMNERMLRMRRQGLPKGCTLVGQFHDAALYECREGRASKEMEKLIRTVYGEPVELPNGRRFMLPIDFKVGGRLSEVA